MNQVRFGIVGYGNQGSYLAGLFTGGQISQGTLAAVCDVNPAKIRAAKSVLGDGVRYFGDYKEMIAAGCIDAVIVAVPHYDHPSICTDFLRADIHTLCEKPAGVYTRQVEEMNSAAKQSKALFAMMFNQRTNCVYRKMREILQSGGIGTVQRVNWIITHWYRNQSYYDSASWRATWAGEGGGVLINQCPHQIDLMQWILGEMPVAATSFCQYGRWHDIEVEDEVTAYFEFPCGATGVFITTTGETPGTNRLEISGTMGKLLCENEKLIYIKNTHDALEFSKTATEPFARPDCRGEIVETDGENTQHAGIINNFAAAVLGKEPLFVPGEEGIRGVEIMNAVELSTWLGNKRVAFPIDGDLYLQKLNEHRSRSRQKAAVEERISDPTGKLV